jgi:hypothetical protein
MPEHERLFRIGSPLLVNKSKFDAIDGFDALFNSGNSEFVYLPDFGPWKRVNDTWQGALGHILHDTI